jgi:hypothetical protein
MIPPGVGALPEEWEDKKRLGCADSEEGGKCEILEGLEAGGSVGEELGITSPWLEGSLGRPKDNSGLAESASGCVASGGGVTAGCTNWGEAVIHPSCIKLTFNVSACGACESGTINIPWGGSAPLFAIYESQRKSTTGVPHTLALAYFAPAADGHNKWVAARLNVGA